MLQYNLEGCENMIEVKFVELHAMKTEMQNKQKVLRYLKHGKHPIVAPMFYKDRETNKPAVEAYYLDDGVYTWSSDIIYHFEKYNYPLPDDFIEYVLSNSEKR